MAEITVPIVLTADATAKIFSEVAPATDVSYAFTMNSSGLTAQKLKDFVSYTDDDSDNTLFSYSSNSATVLLTGLQQDICNQSITHDLAAGQPFPNHSSSVGSATIGEMLVKYIASVLFGHPEAQAPIENDDEIIKSVQVDSTIAQQFVDELKSGLDNVDISGDNTIGKENYVLQSIFEQLIAYSSETDASGGVNPDSNRFGDKDDTGVFHGIPFLTGDKIVFLINMSGTLAQDANDHSGDLPAEFEAGGDSTLVDLFGSNPEVSGTSLNAKIWQLTITLA